MATATDKTKQGADREFEFEVVDDATEAPINLSTLEGIFVHLIYENLRILQKYSLVSKADFETLTIVDGPNGILSVKLQSKTTQNADLGDIFVEIKTEDDNGDFDDSTKHDLTDDALVTQIVRSVSRDEKNLA